MARETKIGLLVGIAFIVCFAIILSNRGGERLGNPTMPYRVLADRTVKPADSTATSAERRAHDYGRRRPTAAEGPADRPDVRVVTSETGDTGRFYRRGTPIPVTPDEAEQATPAWTVAEFEPVQDDISLSSVEPSSDPGFLPVVAPDMEDPRASRKPSPTSDSFTATVPSAAREYVVQPGDSLSKIAKKHYGSAGRKIVRSIFEANRARMASPDVVKVGQTLVLPELNGRVKRDAGQKRVSPGTADRESRPATRVEDAPATNAKPTKRWRWYQVKKGDLYSTIAQRELGTSKRWKELHEFNKDIFPDPGKIRWGVKIRVPVNGDTAREKGPSQ